MPLPVPAPEPGDPCPDAARGRSATARGRKRQRETGLSPGDLQALASELDLTRVETIEALAEWRRTGRAAAPVGSGSPWARRLVGPAQVLVARRCPVAAAAALAAVSRGLVRQHRLRVISEGTDHVVARRPADPLARASRFVRALNAGVGLHKVGEVRAGTGPLADGSVALYARADVSDGRSRAIATGCSLGTLGAAVMALGATVSSVLWLTSAPAVLLAGILTARWSYRRMVRQVRRDLGDLVEAAVRGDNPRSLFHHLGRSFARHRRNR